MSTVYDMDASPDFERDGICFAACDCGLSRSEDGGRTWHNAYASLHLDTPLPTTAVVVSSDFPGDRSVFAGVPGAVLRSSDGGETWEAAPLPQPPPYITRLAVSPAFTRDGVLFAATLEDGVFRSAERGCGWAAWNFGLLDLRALSLGVSPGFEEDETLFAGTESGVFRSTNGGRAWRETAFPFRCAPVISLSLSPCYPEDGVLFAGTESCGLWYSGDRGRSWTRLGEETLDGPVNTVLLSPRFPADPALLVVLPRELLVSRDGGRSWSRRVTGLRTGQGVVCAVAPSGLDPAAPLLVGLAEEGVHRIEAQPPRRGDAGSRREGSRSGSNTCGS